MLPSRAPALCLLLSLSTVSAFLPPSPVIPQLSHSIASSSSKLYLAGEVFPERSPGVEVRRVADTDAGTGIGRYGIKGMVSASDYKNIYRESQKEHKKQANFPGFRAGKIPPGLMVAVREFSIVTAIETAALAALEPYELEAVIPPNGVPELKINVPGDVTAFARAYNGKDDFEFDCEVEGTGEPKLTDAVEEEAPSVPEGADVTDVIDTKAEVVG
uniref:Trigger factor ribosome-binding bacterial domain-containing protein n=1 Tax=Nannochloropsis gaditana (strain CCMP526) TaxID=1093141 RepID=I2CPL5_NANGC